LTEGNEYAKRRLAELYAAAPVKSKKDKPFAIVELDAAARAFAAMNCPKAMVYVWLVHEVRKTGNRTVPVPNGMLAKYGVTRETKRRALKELEADGLMAIKRRPLKTPCVTLL
jgi:hypothetical protein